MKTALLHLSDIHIDSPRHPVLNRAHHIATALSSQLTDVAEIIVVVTGDIAQSGKAYQYELASVFFHQLADRLNESTGATNVQYVFVPGNHDCDFDLASDVRDPDIIESKLATLDLDGALLKHFLAVQAPFFTFAARHESQDFQSPQTQLFHERLIRCGDATVRFSCFNTAWLTQNPERPSRLFFPLSAVEDTSTNPSDADLKIAVFHHPFNWLNPVNAQEFKHVVESRSDVSLSGHEHTADSFVKHRPGDQIVHCVEADALWEPIARTSSFNVLLFDLASCQYRVTAFAWNEGTYWGKPLHSWQPFQKNAAARKGLIENNFIYQEYLKDLGAGFSHRFSLKSFSLPDLFVYPDLVKRLYEVRTSAPTPGTRVRSAIVPEYMYDNKRVLIVGEGQSGKTSLAKTLYSDLQRRNLIPVMLSGKQLRGTDDQIVASIDKSFAEQYSAETLPLFQTKPKSQKLFIIDDLHLSRLSVDRQSALLPLLHRIADRTVVLVDESAFNISEIATKGSKRPFAEYKQCEIFPFCPSLRRKLIRKWVELAAGDDVTQDELDREIKARDEILGTFLPRQSLPPFPINILALLQAYEARTDLNTTNGSYGELCHSMITERLRRANPKAPAEISTQYAFLARLAHFMFDNEQAFVSQQDLTHIKTQYFTQYDIELNTETLINDAIKAQLFSVVDGNYRFRYNAYFYFFAAKFFSDAAKDPEEAASTAITIVHIADHLYYEPYVNILIFYLYFTHDIPAIKHIVGNANTIYRDHVECALESEVDFLNKLYIEPPKPLLISEGELQQHREQHQNEIDEEDLAPGSANDDDVDRTVTYADSLDHLKKLNIAFKTLQVLGQVLRNFPNVLRSELKTGVARACYSLGLRIMSVMLEISRENLEDLRRHFAAILKEQRRFVSDSKLATDTDTFMIRLIGGCMYSITHRVSGAVGSEQLSETYRNVLSAIGYSPSVGLIDLSIKLDHFTAFPVSEIERLYRTVETNRFTYGLLRDLVVNGMLLRDLKPENRRRVGHLLQISVAEITDGANF